MERELKEQSALVAATIVIVLLVIVVKVVVVFQFLIFICIPLSAQFVATYNGPSFECSNCKEN